MSYCYEYIAWALFGLLTFPTTPNWLFEDMTWQMLADVDQMLGDRLA